MKNAKFTKRKVVTFIVTAALVLSLGTVGVLAVNANQAKRLATTDEIETLGIHVVTAEEYEAILSGEISLDDGVSRVWINPDAQEQAGIAVHGSDVDYYLSVEEIEALGIHVVTAEEYEAIIAGDMSLDDGVSRVWITPDVQERAGISKHN